MNQPGAVTCGYIGFGNLGDEAVHSGLINSIRAAHPDWPIRVMTSDAEHTRESYGCETVNRMNVLAVWKAMSKSRLFVLGGGSLFQDVTSLRNSLYYGVMAMMAKRAHCHVIWSGQGIGPIHRPWLGRWIAKLASQADCVCVRDQESAVLLSRYGYHNAVASADLAFLMKTPAHQSRNGFIAVAPRETPNLDDEFWIIFADVLSKTCNKHNLKPFYIAMQPDEDTQLCLRLNSLVPGDLLIDAVSPTQVATAIGSCKFGMSVRLHALILGCISGIPSVGIAYDPKVTAIWKAAVPELLVTPGQNNRLSIESAVDTLVSNIGLYDQRIRNFTNQQRELACSALNQQLRAME